MTTVYLTVDEVLLIHDAQIERFGGSRGVRARELLDAAVARPQSGYYSDLTSEAAALWESLSQNHPFVDGNKRTAFASTYTFLRLNGLTMTAQEPDAIAFVLSLYESHSFTFANLEVWLRNNTCAKSP